jgi:UPF0755 protein
MSKFSLRKWLFIFSGLAVLIMTALAFGFVWFLNSPADMEAASQVVVIKEGMSLKEVAENLEQHNIITSQTLFMQWARFNGYSRMIKAGEYQLSPDMTPLQIMEKIIKGIIITHPVTIPEGYSINQIAELLADKGLVDKDKFLIYTQDKKVLEKYDISGPNLEGHLYPDTYNFGLGLSCESITDTMIKRFQEIVKPLLPAIKQSGRTLNEVVTLASIVEKETGKAEERPLIASVFLNRIRMNMRLESDPTVIYGIKDFNGNITKKDLSRKTPYNTYVIRGIPPGPIANPGYEAIHAVIYPDQTEYLYFVSKNDGSHYFSKDLKEHNRAVYTYQKTPRSN